MENKKVAFDCGHGLKTAGKQTPDGIKEWTLNDKVRDKVVLLLADYNVDFVFPDNNEGNVDESLTARRTMYVKAKVDAAVSIHHNALNGKWGTHTGVEVFVDRNATAKDKKLAELIYGNMVQEIGLKGRGIKEADFTVINQDEVPAVLCEGGFMDSKKDHPVVTSNEGQDAYARAIANGLIEFLGLVKVTPTVDGVFTVGEVVNFTGNKHYTSSNAATGSTCKPGKAKVTHISKGAKHPYHLVREQGQGSTVYGWVDAKDIREISIADDMFYPKYKGASTQIDEVLKSIGVPSKYRGSYAKRKPIAEANGIRNYSGTAIQNVRLINLASKGLLIKI